MAHGDKKTPKTILPPVMDDTEIMEADFEPNREDKEEIKDQMRITRAVIANQLRAPWIDEVQPEDIILESSDELAAYFHAKERMRTRAAEAKAGTDELSGLGNRRSFDEKFRTEFKRAERYKTPFSLIVVDIVTSKK